MREIIKTSRIELDGSEVNSVNSRDIYEYLEVKTEYRNWIKRSIDKYDFEDGIDFQGVQNRTASGQTASDYIVTMDMEKSPK